MSRSVPLPRSVAFFKAAFEQHPQAMWIYDADDLSVLALNAAAVRHSGRTLDDAPLRVFELHPEADAERAASWYLDGHFAHGRKREWTHVRKDGTTLEVEATIARLGSEAGNTRLLVAEDVTERNRAERALRESKQRYAALIGDAYEAICLVNADGEIIYLSPALHRMFGYEDGELLGHDGFALLHREDVSRVEELRRDLLARPGMSLTFECRARNRSGEWRWLQGIAVNMLEDPGVRALVLNYRDVTERRRSENALRHGEHTGGVDEWMFELDREGRFTFCSPAVERMIGFKPEELVGRHFTDFYFPESREKVTQFFNRIVAARSGWTDLVQRLRHRDGTECYVEASAVPLFDEHDELIGFRGSDRDITSRARFEQRVRYGSRRDPLTGLPNRLFFQERLASVLATIARNGTGEQTAVLFIDLDHFKLLNDTFGHTVGDNALQVITSMIRAVTGTAENVARVGGDEFTVFLPGVDGLTEANAIAKKIFDAVSVPLVLEGNQVHISATIGISLSPWDGDTSAALTRNAEHAMHRAKELGRCRIQHFTPEMREEQARRMALESDLRRALDRDELVLHYQPIYTTGTWRMAGIEALLRWQHPSRGLLPPDDFIEIAERTGVIGPIGAWVLRQACIDLQRLRTATGIELRVSVNLSARQLQPELIDTIRTILTDTGIDAHALELEITESVAMQNAEATLAALRALKDMGVSLAVDDFGTGYSSLLYLTRFPIDTVKIDRQFVGTVTSDPNAAMVVGAVVALAHSLQLKTVAEGVETMDQRDFLAHHMCAEMQGYLLGRPVRLEELLRAEAGDE
ncbi:MAG TPA: EAL domain-containing protein [Thermoanaerobaculia bacterium]|nr:EAL domain-containing protein [Thermoanaerobaculia bacterium]